MLAYFPSLVKQSSAVPTFEILIYSEREQSGSSGDYHHQDPLSQLVSHYHYQGHRAYYYRCYYWVIVARWFALSGHCA